MGSFRRRLRHIFSTAAAAGCAMLSSGCVSTGGLHGRPLTHSEKELAREVFGDDVQYTKVKVYNGPPTFAGFIKLTDGHQDAVTPNGNIFITDDQCRREDFSLFGDDRSRRLFIHEMTHVWQYQQGRHILWEAAGVYISKGFNYNAAYPYDVDLDKPFSRYNLEQQAHMVEDYFDLRDKTEDREKFQKLKDKIQPFLPLRKPPPVILPPQDKQRRGVPASKK